jgi:hypothetical protein
MHRKLLSCILVLAVLTPGVVAAETTLDSPESAALDIRQPHYIDDTVDVDTSGNTTTYIASGRVLYLTPTNFDTSAVTDYGIREDAGQLTEDEATGAYQLDTEGTNGTFHVYWVVEEQQTTTANNTTTTETVTTRYTAAVQVSRTQMDHVPAGTLDEYREDAQNWREWERSLKEIAGPGVNIEQKTQTALNRLRITENPSALFTGGILALFTILVTSLGAALVFLLDRIRELLAHRQTRKELNKQKSLDADRATTEEMLDELDREETSRTTARMDISEVMESDEEAELLREVYGDTVAEVAKAHQADMLDSSVARDRLQAMALADYHAAVRWSDQHDDLRARLVPGERVPQDVDDDEFSLPLMEEHDGEPYFDNVEWVLPVLERDDDEFLRFDLADADIDRSRLDADVRTPHSVEGVAEQFREQPFQFHDDARYAECLRDLYEDIKANPVTKPNGQPDSVRERLEMVLTFNGKLRDRAQWPTAHIHADRYAYALDSYDPVADAEETMREAQEGSYV